MEKKRKIEYPIKDTMLFVLNDIFNETVKESYTKKKLIEISEKVYEDEENILKLLDVLPYESYLLFEKIYDAYINGKDYKSLVRDEHFLCDIMLYRVEYEKETVTTYIIFNIDLIEKAKILFTKENKLLAEKKNIQEKVIRGLLYTYGIMKDSYFYSFFNSYCKTNLSPDDILRFMHIRLSLNEFVQFFGINWQNINEEENYITFLEYNEDLGAVAESQKQLNYNYNLFDLDYIINKSKDELDSTSIKFLDYLRDNLKGISEDDLDKLMACALLGKNDIEFLTKHFDGLEESKIQEIMDALIEWHNNLPAYGLCGYTPNNLEEATIN